MRTGLSHFGALAIFVALSIAIFGVPLLARGFASFRIGAWSAGDPQVYMWGMAWYPHAITRGLDPLETTAVWAPTGFNLAWSTTVPGASLAAWPLTRLWGLIPAYNVLTVLAPALASFSAFVLCLYLTGAFWPSMVGGAIFGFSPYMQVQLTGHMVLFLVFVVPLLPYLVLQHLQGRIRRPAFVTLFALCLIFQFLLFPEIFATATIFGVVAMLAAPRFFPATPMAPFRRAALSLAIAYGVAVLVLSPYLARFLARQYDWLPIYNPAHCSTDLLNFFFPTTVSALGRWLPSLGAVTIRSGDTCEPGGYLGLFPLLGALFLWKSPQRKLARYLTAMFVLICLASLGPVLHVSGIGVAPWLWLWAVPVPLLNNALPARFMTYAFLVAGSIVAFWLAEGGQEGSEALPGHPHPGQGEGVQSFPAVRAENIIIGISHQLESSARKPVARVFRWLLAGAVVISLMPEIPFSRWVVKADLPEFFTRQMYSRYLSRDETVLILPYGETGNCMLWQAASNFYFRMPQGWLGTVPREFQAWPIVGPLGKDAPYVPGFEGQFRAFLAGHEVGAIVVGDADHPAFQRLCATVKAERLHVGGVFLYRLDRESLAPYRHLGAAEMESRFNLLRLQLLIGAAGDYLASGRSLDQLSPLTVMKMGLLPDAMVGDEPRSQVYGYWPLSALRRTPAFQRIVSWVMRTAPLRYRLAQELGPAPKFSATTTGIWLGPWDDGAVAIGVVGTAQGLRSVVSSYGGKAEKVYFPYPVKYTWHLNEKPTAPQLLLMVFRPETVQEVRSVPLQGRPDKMRSPPTRAAEVKTIASSLWDPSFLRERRQLRNRWRAETRPTATSHAARKAQWQLALRVSATRRNWRGLSTNLHPAP